MKEVHNWTVFGYDNEIDRNHILAPEIIGADSKQAALGIFLERHKDLQIGYLQITGPMELTEEDHKRFKEVRDMT